MTMQSTEDRVARATAAAERFKKDARAPIVIEFAGLPKAGKTTTLGQVQSFLKRCGFRAEIVVERASVCPIRDKKHSNFNVWTACTTLAQILEKTQTPPRADDPEILILDRGIFDAICWFSVMEHLARVRKNDRLKIEEFLGMSDWSKRISGVILMTADPNDSIEREKGHLPVEGSAGSIMNINVLTEMRETILATADRLKGKYRIKTVNTSEKGFDQTKTCEVVADQVLDWIEGELREDILSLPKADVARAFSGAPSIGKVEAAALIQRYEESGEYAPREDVEVDLGRVQALPIVVVRNKAGGILRLRRKERDENSTLHEKVVIWAGGHARKEDAELGSAILNCAVRELQEELRISIEPADLSLLGAIYSNSNGGTSKHVALVFDWQAAQADVEVAISNAEFFERRGNSLSGTFVSPEEILQSVNSDKLTEEWSEQIVKSLLPTTAGKVDKGLFD